MLIRYFILTILSFAGAIAFASNDRMAEDDYFEELGRTDPPSVPDYRNRSQPGENFGTGKLTSSIGNQEDALRATAVLSDGKILGVGRAGTDIGLMQFNPDGSLDTAFNSSGKQTTVTASGGSLAHSAALGTNGLIYAAGKTSGSPNTFLVLRYVSNGRLDTAFATVGYKTLDIGGTVSIARTCAVQTDGKVVTAGYAHTGTGFDFALARFETNGSLDTSFSTTGSLTTVVSAAQASGILGLFLQTNGKLVAAGHTYNGSSNWDLAVVRYNEDGSLDTSFATTGKATFAVGTGNDLAFSIVGDTAGRLVVGGNIEASNLDALIVRLKSDGVLDTSFQTLGTLSFSAGSGDDVISSLYLQTNGRIAAAGTSYNGSNRDMMIFRVSTNGSVDTSFNTRGYSVEGIGSQDDFGMALAAVPDRTLFLAGRTYNGSNLDFGIVRFGVDGALARSGDRDLSFGTNGRLYLQLSFTQRIALQTNGQILHKGSGLTRRINENGTLDSSFSTNASGHALLEIDFLGRIHDGSKRYLPSGLLDTAFNTSGTSQLSSSDFAVYDLSGRVTTYSNTLLRITSNGRFDTSFSSSSLVAVYSVSVRSAPESNYLVAGLTTDGMNFLLYRTTSNGNLDTSFYTTGSRQINEATGASEINNAEIGVNGEIWLFGGMRLDNPDKTPFIYRLTSNGTLDTAFSERGRALFPGFGDATFSWGSRGFRDKLIVTGYSNDLSRAIMLRVESNGQLDSNFTTAGNIQNTKLNQFVLDRVGFILSAGDGAIYRYYP